jgi:hypothetical protein
VVVYPRSREIFAVTRSVRDAPDVLVTRLIDGHITDVHEVSIVRNEPVGHVVLPVRKAVTHIDDSVFL